MYQSIHLLFLHEPKLRRFLCCPIPPSQNRSQLIQLSSDLEGSRHSHEQIYVSASACTLLKTKSHSQTRHDGRHQKRRRVWKHEWKVTSSLTLKTSQSSQKVPIGHRYQSTEEAKRAIETVKQTPTSLKVVNISRRDIQQQKNHRKLSQITQRALRTKKLPKTQWSHRVEEQSASGHLQT